MLHEVPLKRLTQPVVFTAMQNVEEVQSTAPKDTAAPAEFVTVTGALHTPLR